MNAHFFGLMRGAALAALLCTAPALDAQTIAITGGKVFPVSGPPIENGTVIIRNGKIEAVGAGIAVPADAQVINATGKWVTPGLIHSATQLGLAEIGQVASSRDDVARGRDQIAAAFTVWDGLNTRSQLFWPARDEGITSVAVVPGGGGLIWGQAAFLNLSDGSVSDMVVRSPIAMVGQIGSSGQAGTGARAETMLRLRELLEDADAFARNRPAFERSETRDYLASRKDLEAMIPVVRGQLPLLIEADRAADIEALLHLAREYNLKLWIAGGTEAWMVADRLAAANVPVLTGAMNNIPRGFTALGARQDNAALLRRAGVKVLLVASTGGTDGTFNVRNIRQEAGNAVAYGMSWDDALRAATLGPAEVFGVSDRYGSLQAGRVADVVVWTGDPFEFATQAEHVIVRGIVRNVRNRQELLTDRYKTLPPTAREP